MKTVLIPLPEMDFDLTKVPVLRKLLKTNGHKIVFATEHGKIAKTDTTRVMITGKIEAQNKIMPQNKGFQNSFENFILEIEK